MEIIISAVSILSATTLVWLFNKVTPYKICPICAGVSLTWFLISLGIFSGSLEASSWKLVAIMLMGATVVGIVYQTEKKFGLSEKNIFLFKVPLILGGFILVYLAVENINLITLVAEALLMALLAYLFFVMPVAASDSAKTNLPIKKEGGDEETVKALEEKMKECC